MAKITSDPRRPGILLITHTDVFGKRRRPSFPDTPAGRKQAEQELAIINAQGRRDCAVDSDITVSDYARHFIVWKTTQARSGKCSSGTVVMYETMLTLHVIPDMGRFRVRAISRQMVERLLAAKGLLYAHAHVGNMLAALSAMLTRAQDEGLVDYNPLFRMGKAVRGIDWARQINTQAMEREQRDLFLDTALVTEPRWYPALATLTYAGLRMGELRGLQRQDIRSVEIRVERQVYAKADRIHPGRVVGPPKGSKPGRVKRRSVDMAEQLVPILHPLVTRPGSSPWLFFDAEPSVSLARHFTKGLAGAMVRIQEECGLMRPAEDDPERLVPMFTPHDLRHTFITMLLTQEDVQTGDLLLYVSQQAGHDSTMVTEQTYGRWLQPRNRAAVTAGAARAKKSAADVPLSAVVLPFRK